MKKEAKWQTVWNQYVRQKKIYGYFELKQTETESIPFTDVKPHQLSGLEASENNGFCWKLSDADFREKPFDSFFALPAPSYVVIKFPDAFYMIRTFLFIKEMKESNRKSLTVDRAKEICCKRIIC